MYQSLPSIKDPVVAHLKQMSFGRISIFLGVFKTTPLGSDLDNLDMVDPMVDIDIAIAIALVYTYFTYLLYLL